MISIGAIEMQRKQKFSQIKEKVREFMRRSDFRDESRVCEKDFTRKRKLSFVDYMTLILLGCKKSMQVWLDYISDEIKSTKGEYSKQAFSQGRQRIRPEAFLRIFRETVAGFYEDGHYRTYRGYRVCAIDGSDYNLPNTPELLAIYGSETYKDKTQVQAQGSCLFDVLNEVILDVAFTPCRTGERVPAMQHIEQLSEITTGKELLVLDRGYPSEQLLRACMKQGFHFIMRCNKDNFFREVRDVTEPDAVITRACGNGETLQLRVVTIPIPSGTATFLTDLDATEFSATDLKEVYLMRWRIETFYDNLKNKLEMENFSGISQVAIVQDFYATMTLWNFVAALEFDATQQMNLDLAQHRVNRAMVIHEVKNSFIEMMMASGRKQRKLLDRIMKRLQTRLVQVVPGRSFPRTRLHRSLKFSSNHKSAF